MKLIIVKFISAALITAALCSLACADEGLNSLFYNTFSLGYLKVRDTESAAAFWRGNLDYQDFFLGVDVNLPSSPKKVPGVDTIVVRSAKYDTGVSGLIYGEIKNLELGQGLLLHSYSSLDKAPVVPGNDGAGLYAYYEGLFDMVDLKAFSTWSHLYGLRVTEDVGVFTFGQMVIADADGEQVKTEGGIVKNIKDESGASFDIWAPIFGDFDLYSEIASLSSGATGYSFGINWGYDAIVANVSARIEARGLNRGFAPAYFGWGYELNPVDLTSLEAYGMGRSGYYAEFRGQVFNFFGATIAYEGYDDSNGAFFLDSWVKITQPLVISAYIKQPNFVAYRGTSFYDGMLLGGRVSYDISPSMYLATEAKKGFNPDIGEVEESALAEVGLMF